MTNLKGSFIWYELMTGDPDGAARFYGAVVGWTIAGAADPAVPGGVDYRMFGRSDGGNAGGMLALNADMLAGGARPGWLGYLYTPTSMRRSPRSSPTAARSICPRPIFRSAASRWSAIRRARPSMS